MNFASRAFVTSSLKRPHRRPSPTRSGPTALPPLCLYAALAAALAVVLPHAHAATVTSTWIGGDGAWTDLAHWSNSPAMAFWPKNGNGGFTYEALINGTGPLYSITLDTNITLDRLTLDAPDGTLRHTNGTLAAVNAIDLLGGTYRVDGGTIANSRISVTGGARLQVTSTTSLLDGVRLAGELSISNGAQPKVSNNLTLEDGAIRVVYTGGWWWTCLNFPGEQTLSGSGQVIFDGGANSSIGGQPLTIGKNIAIHTGTGGGWVGGTVTGYRVINYGTISAETVGQTITVYGKDWINRGVLQAKNGGILDLQGSGTNEGTLANEGGTVNFTGTLNNTGSTLVLSGSNGSWNVTGGKIAGGKISVPGGARLQVTSTASELDGVTLAGELSISNGAQPKVSNNLTLEDGAIRLVYTGGWSWTCLNFPGEQTLSGSGQVIFDGGANSSIGGQPLTIGENITIRTGTGGGWVGGTVTGYRVINYGTISAETVGQTITMYGKDWVNRGSLQAKNGGILNLQGSWTNPGVIDINSRMQVQTTASTHDAIAAMVLDQIKSARAADWPQTGITSSAAHDDERDMTSLGYRIVGNTIDVKYTWLGDANLDGVVNADDYFLIDSNYIPQNPGWYNGDFNYDNVINADDYFLIDSAFLSQTGPLSDPSFLPSLSPIPEPSLLLPLALSFLLPRRRRIHRFLPPFRLPPSPPNNQ